MSKIKNVIPVVGMEVDTMGNEKGVVIDVSTERKRACVDTRDRTIFADFKKFIELDGKVILNHD